MIRSGGQFARRLHLADQLQNADIRNQHAAQAQFDRAPDIFQSEDQLIGAAQAQPQRLAGGRKTCAPISKVARGSDEEIHLNAGLASHRQHLDDFGVGHEHDAAALADAMHRDLRAFAASSSTAASARGPSVLGISMRYCAAVGEAQRWKPAPRPDRPGHSPMLCRNSRDVFMLPLSSRSSKPHSATLANSTSEAWPCSANTCRMRSQTCSQPRSKKTRIDGPAPLSAHPSRPGRAQF